MRLPYKGILFTLLVGAIAYGVAPWLPWINQVLAGLLLGMLLGNLWKLPESLQAGVKYTGTKLLEVSVIFLAFGIRVEQLAALGGGILLALVLLVASVLLLTGFLARKLQYTRSISWLIGFGIAFCGSSAIAALSPLVAQKREDAGIALAVVNLFGLLGMLLLPFVLLPLGWKTEAVGFLLGASLHSVGNVTGAAYAISKATGEVALTVKMARVALLSPALLLFVYFTQEAAPAKRLRQIFQLPWYLWGFLLITLGSFFLQLPAAWLVLIDKAGIFILTVAMSGIGLQVSFKTLYQSGKRGLVLGALLFAFQLAFAAIAWWLVTL
ncbi:MAG TPA: hypothetical protein DCM08_11820 [Microscillaceae bacterium]|nr:hypothetical protein [Microscillaceae bacterium]